jgi:hypothetical protein
VPLFHAAALYITIICTFYWDRPIALGISGKPLTPEFLIDNLKYSGADAAVLAPATIEEMGHTVEGTEVLSRLSLVGFGGGEFTSTLQQKQESPA